MQEAVNSLSVDLHLLAASGLKLLQQAGHLEDWVMRLQPSP
jgi:hypothetical protein